MGITIAAGIRADAVLNFRTLIRGVAAISANFEPESRFDDAQAHLRAGDAAGALSICDVGLKEWPGDANFLCLAARANLLLKKTDKARDLLEEAIRLHPDFAVAHDVFGDLMFSLGYADAAIRAYEQALRLDPARPAIITKIEKIEELKKHPGRQVESRGRGSAPARRMAFEDEINTALAHRRAGEPHKAETIYRDILNRDRDHVEAARLLAGIAVENNKLRDAEVFLRHAAIKAPDYVRLWVDLANVLREQDRHDEALECVEKALALAPDLAESHMLYATVIGALGDHEGAIRSFRKALEISPEKSGAMCNIGHHLKTIGRQDESIAMYRQCIAVNPDHAESYWSLANLKTFQFEQLEVETMLELLSEAKLADNSRAQIHNALGLHFEREQEYDRAFRHFEQCNLITRKAETYDPVDNEDIHDRAISIFTPDFIDANDGNGCEDVSPIFIVGLPRSGSTLIEQILASHSQVDGTHELGELGRTVQAFRRASGKGLNFPEIAQEIATESWSGLGEDYISATMKYRAGAPFFIDKNPNNYLLTGLLRLALPNAKVINARRHPLDSCLGSYKQLFASGQPFSYDLEEVGEYYLQYQRLMDHWHQLLPGFVLDVQYENVVTDLEAQVGRILEFCGLPFENGCLRFYETDRAVKTASSEQVRRPIYASSVNLWRNYEIHLDELIRVIEPVLVNLPLADSPAILSDSQATSPHPVEFLQ